MRWEIGDMTDMQAIANESFDIVFDKGALDALVSDSSRENLQQSGRMFDEIDRVLVGTGAYICVSLAEEFILKGLIAHFAHSKAWEMSVQTIECEKISPFKPFFFNITKIPTTQSCGGLRLWFDSFGATVSSPLIKPSQYAVELVRYRVTEKYPKIHFLYFHRSQLSKSFTKSNMTLEKCGLVGTRPSTLGPLDHSTRLGTPVSLDLLS
jgi:hypothetical protein